MRSLVILNDVWIPPDLAKRIIQECGVTLIECGNSVADEFWEKLLRPRIEASARPLLVVVEGSGERVWEWVQARVVVYRSRPLVTQVFAKRLISSSQDALINGRRDPYWLAGEISTARFVDPTVLDVILVDDFIGSGNTVRKIRERNAWKFPKATWQALAWVGRSEAKPGMNWEVVHRVGSSRGRKVPINSISKLLEDPTIARDYARRNFDNPAGFLEIIDEINAEREADFLHHNIGAAMD